MSRFNAGSRLTVTSSVVFAPTAAGCTQVVNAGLGLLGGGDHGRGSLVDPTAPSRSPDATPAAPAAHDKPSTYESAPPVTWRPFAVGQPYSVGRSLFQQHSSLLPACPMVPLGANEVLPVPFGSTGYEVGRAGWVVFGVAGQSIFDVREGGPVFNAGALGFERQVRTAGDAYAGVSCRGGSFLYLGLAGSKGVEPVTVRR